MFMMFQQNYNFCSCPPFMFGGLTPFMMGNPRMNFFMGLAANTAGMQNPMFSTYMQYPQMPVYNNYSVFQPNFGANYTNPALINGFGTTYQTPVFNFPQFNIQTPAIWTQTNTQMKNNTAKENENEESVATNNETRPQGEILRGKGKGTQYGPEFLKRVKQIAKNLNCNYRDLLAIMNSESGINAKTVGKNGASGLICFMPEYFNVAKIRKMSPMEQLDFVESTIKSAKKIAGFASNAKLSKGDLYALVFLPGRAGNEVLCQKGERGKDGRLLNYYESNSELDYNGDKKITKEEMATRIDKKYVSNKTFLA